MQESILITADIFQKHYLRDKCLENESGLNSAFVLSFIIV